MVQRQNGSGKMEINKKPKGGIVLLFAGRKEG
jgi:hypothetical protein